MTYLTIMKKIIFAVLALVVVSGSIGYYLWTKPSEFVSDGDADFKQTIPALIKESQELKDSIFSSKYNGKFKIM